MRRFLLLCMLVVPSIAAADKAGFEVKLPEGLYLYQPYAGDEVFAKGDKDTVRPLVIVEKGRLVDPFLRAQEMGFEKFIQKYVSGKTFSVYVGPELVGKLSSVEFATCSRSEVVPDILGRGKYTGESLPTVASRYITNHPIHVGIKMVMTPALLRNASSMTVFSLSSEEKEKLPKDAKSYFSSGDYLKYEPKPDGVIASSGKIFEAYPLDLDLDGKKDVIGVFHTRVNDRLTDFLMIFRGSGRTEIASFADQVIPAFIFVGVINLDGDQTQELIVQSRIPSKTTLGEVAIKVEIYRHYPSGWRNVYSTASIACH